MMRAALAMMVVLASTPLAAWAQAAPAPVNCAKFVNANCRQSAGFDPAEVRECLLRGYDAPIACRRDEGKSAGVTAGGARGFTYGAVQAPENSPGALGAKPSVPPATIAKGLGFPPWRGFPCTLPGGIDLCKAITKGQVPPVPPAPPTPPADECPQNVDNTGAYGIKQPLAGSSAPALACGGAVPITRYELTLNAKADKVATTEYGAYYLWLYERAGSQFKLTSNSPIKLPSYLCTGGVKSYDLTAAKAQVITFNGTTPSISIRLVPRNEAPLLPPVPPNKTPVELIPPYDPNEPEKFLVIPLSGGVPQVPADCANEADFLKLASDSRADLSIEASITSGCEGTNTQCAGAVRVPSPVFTCDTVNIYPTGVSTLTGTPVDCSGKLLYAVLDRPNLILPPDAQPQSVPFSDRTAVMMGPTNTNAQLFMQSQTVVHVGATAPPLALEEGGTILLQNGGQLVMNPPAVLNAGTQQVTLNGGGSLIDAGGNETATYAIGAVVTPSGATAPYTVKVNRSITLTPDFMVPTQPNPYVNLPIDKP